MDRPDPYEALVRYYDAENAEFVEDFAAYGLLAERFGGPVLDVGCGTGRVSFYLARQGLKVVGVDLSPAMLERARERAALQEIGASRLSWVQADALHMALGERFNLALLTFNTFVHFTEQADQLALLARIAAHLEPGGGLAIDLPNPVEPYRADDVPGLVLERMFTDPATGQVVMQQSLARLDRATQIMTITWIYDRVAPDGQITRTLIPLRIRYNTAGEMRLLLRQSAFGEVEIYGDYDFSSYEEDSPRLLVVAVRDGA